MVAVCVCIDDYIGRGGKRRCPAHLIEHRTRERKVVQRINQQRSSAARYEPSIAVAPAPVLHVGEEACADLTQLWRRLRIAQEIGLQRFFLPHMISR